MCIRDRYKFEDHNYVPSSLYSAQKSFYNFFQYKEMDNTSYLDKFNSLIKVIESYGWSIGNDDALDKLNNYSALVDDADINKAKEEARQQYLAYCFLRGSDSTRYGKLKEDLENDYSQGNNKYPHTITEAYQFLTNYTQYKPKIKTENINSGMSFANNNNNTTNTNNKNGEFEEWAKTATCHECNKKGHIRPNCPKFKKDKKDKNG